MDAKTTAANVPGEKTLTVTALDRAWIVQALDNQAKMLTRSRAKEISGGEIWMLRGKEIDTIAAVRQKFTA